MLAQILTLKLGAETFKLRWDMHAIATFEKLTGSNGLIGTTLDVGGILAALWSAIDAHAASRDEDAPVSYRRLGSLIDTEEKMQEAVDVVTKLLQLNVPDAAEKPASGKGGKAAKRSRSGAATKSAS